MEGSGGIDTPDRLLMSNDWYIESAVYAVASRSRTKMMRVSNDDGNGKVYLLVFYAYRDQILDRRL